MSCDHVNDLVGPAAHDGQEEIAVAEGGEHDQPTEGPVEEEDNDASEVVHRASALTRIETESPAAKPSERPGPVAGEMVSFSSESFHVGSLPGTAGRNPRAEAAWAEVTLPSFEMDRLPYPNDPDMDIVTANHSRAAQLCAAEGKHLCSELQWERACKGGVDATYSSGETYECERGRCDSFEGVTGLGARPEWTGDAADPRLGEVEGSMVRGSARASVTAHRCARRAFRPDRDRDIAFRCCSGEGEVSYPAAPAPTRFRDQEKSREDLRAILAQVPELARFAEGFMPFGLTQANNAVLRGGKTLEDLNGWHVVEGVLRWNPVRGEDVYVFSGRTGDTTILAALYLLEDGSYRHAASFLFEEATTLAVAWTEPSRNELLWSTNWGRAGEGGAIEYVDGRVRIVQR